MFLKKGLVFIGFTCLLLFSKCSFFFNNYYIDPILSYEKALQKGPYDALIVPGFPYHKDSMSVEVKDRLAWATYLYKRGMVKNIIVSGSAVYSPYVESKIMAMYAHQLEIPQKHIFIESKAEHSIENLYFSKKLADKEGFKTVALASDPTQSSFIKNINDKRFKIQVDFIPIIEDTLKTLEKPVPSINQQEAYVKDFVSIVDRESLLKRTAGTRGRKVKQLMRADKKALKQRNSKL